MGVDADHAHRCWTRTRLPSRGAMKATLTAATPRRFTACDNAGHGLCVRTWMGASRLSVLKATLRCSFSDSVTSLHIATKLSVVVRESAFVTRTPVETSRFAGLSPWLQTHAEDSASDVRRHWHRGCVVNACIE